MKKFIYIQGDQALFEGSAQANFGPGKPAGPAVENLCAAFQPLVGPYDVGFGCTPIHSDFGGVVWPFCDTIRTETGLQVCLDVGTSDNFCQDWADYPDGWFPGRLPWVQTHGISLQPSRVNSLIQHHSTWRRFGAVRSHELGFWLQYGVPQERSNKPMGWLNANVLARMPANGALWNQALVAEQIECAADNHVPYIWSEIWFSPQTAQAIKALSQQFPGTIVVMYANNGGYNVSNYWQQQLQQFNGWPVLGGGVSVQTWATDTTGQNFDWSQLAPWLNEFKRNPGLVALELEHVSGLGAFPGFDPNGGGWRAPWQPWHDGTPKPIVSQVVNFLL